MAPYFSVLELPEPAILVSEMNKLYPIEIYADERIAEFERENRMTPRERRKFARYLRDQGTNPIAEPDARGKRKS